MTPRQIAVDEMTHFLRVRRRLRVYEAADGILTRIDEAYKLVERLEAELARCDKRCEEAKP